MTIKIRLVAFALCLTTLSGCLANITLEELVNGAAATTGAVVGTVVGGPTVGAAIGVATSATTAAITKPNNQDPILSLPESAREDALRHRDVWHTIESLGYGALVLLGLCLFIPFWIGLRTPNREHKRLKDIAMDHPDIKSSDLK